MLLHRSSSEESLSRISSGHSSPMSSHVSPMPLALSLTTTQPLHAKVANLNFKSPNLYLATVNGQQCIVSPSEAAFHSMIMPAMQHPNSHSNHSESSSSNNHFNNVDATSSLNRHLYSYDSYRTSNRGNSENNNTRTKKTSRPRSASITHNKAPKQPKSLQNSVRSPPPVSTFSCTDAGEGSAMEALTSAASALLAAVASAADPEPAAHSVTSNVSSAGITHSFRVPSLPAHSISKSYTLHSHGSPSSIPNYSPVLSNVLLPTPVSHLMASVTGTTSPHAHPAHVHPGHALFMPSRVPVSPSGSPRFTALNSQRKSHISVPQLLLSQSTPVSPLSSHPLSQLSSLPALAAAQHEALHLTKDSFHQRRASLSIAPSHSHPIESIRHASDNSSLLSLLSACNASSRNFVSSSYLSDGDSSDETSSSEYSSSNDERDSEIESSGDDAAESTPIDSRRTVVRASTIINETRDPSKPSQRSLQRKRPSQRRTTKFSQSPSQSNQNQPSDSADMFSNNQSGATLVQPIRKRASKKTKLVDALKVEIPVVKKRTRRPLATNVCSTAPQPMIQSPFVKAETESIRSDIKSSADEQHVSESTAVTSDRKTVDSILNELLASEGAGKRGRATRNSLLSVLDSMLDSSPKKQRASRRKGGVKDESCSENTSAPSTPFVVPDLSPSMPPLILSPLAPSSTSSIGTSASHSLHLATPILQLESPAAAQTAVVARSLGSTSSHQALQSTSVSLLFKASLSCAPDATIQVKIEPTPQIPLVTIKESNAEHSVESSIFFHHLESSASSRPIESVPLKLSSEQLSTIASVDSHHSTPPSRKRSRPNSRRSSITEPLQSSVVTQSHSILAPETSVMPDLSEQSKQLNLDIQAESATNEHVDDDIQGCDSSELSHAIEDVAEPISICESTLDHDKSCSDSGLDADDMSDVAAEDDLVSASEESESERQARLKREERATAAFLKSLLKNQPARTRSEAKMSKVKRRIREHTLVELAVKQRSSKRRRTSGESTHDASEAAGVSGDEQLAADTAATADAIDESLTDPETLLNEQSVAIRVSSDDSHAHNTDVSPNISTDIADAVVRSSPIPSADQLTAKQAAHSSVAAESTDQRAGETQRAGSSDANKDAETESDEEVERRPRSNSTRRGSRMNDDDQSGSDSSSESDSSEDIDLTSTDLDEFSDSSTSSSSSEEVTESSSSEEEEQPKKRRRSELDKLHEGFAAIVHMEKKKSRRAERERIRQERKAADAALRDQLRQIRAEERYQKLKEKRIRLRAEIRARADKSETPDERAAKMERRRAREVVLKARQIARTERRRVREEARKKRREGVEAEEAEAEAEEDEAKVLADARKARAAAFKLEKQKRRDIRRQRKKLLLEELLKKRENLPVKPRKPTRPIRDSDKPPVIPDREPAKPKRKPLRPVIPSRPTARQAILSLIAEARDDSSSSSSSTDSPSSPELPARQSSKPTSSTIKPKPSSSSAERGASRAVVRKPQPATNMKGLSAVERRRLEQEKARASERVKTAPSTTSQSVSKAAPVRSRASPPSRPSTSETKQPVKATENKSTIKPKAPIRDSTARPIAKKEQKQPVKEVSSKASVPVSVPSKPVRRNKRIHDSDDDDVAAPDGEISTDASLSKKVKVDAIPSIPSISFDVPSPSLPPSTTNIPAVIPAIIATITPNGAAPVVPPRQAKTMNSSYWTEEELSSLRSGVDEFGHNFDAIKRHFPALFKRRTPPNLREKAISLTLGTPNQ